MMTSKERIMCAINGQKADFLPLTTWSFGIQPPKHLRWKNDWGEVNYWYTKRLEHIHTLPLNWTLEDDFKRALAWQSLGVDDVLEVSVPWSMHPEVSWEDSIIKTGDEGGDSQYPVIVRDYKTPGGKMRHEVKQTGEEPFGWPTQPHYVPIIEDYNIPRARKHLVAMPEDVENMKYLFAAPDANQKNWFLSRMAEVERFSRQHGFFVQAWTSFGMDAVIWFTGVDNAIMMSMTDPKEFGRLIDIIAETDYKRTELAVQTPGIDMVVQRGWYSSTNFWSPESFDAFVFPHLSELTALAHKHGKKFGYVMTTGVEILGPRLADADVDLVFFVDPVQDQLSLRKAKELFENRMTMVGGINSISLNTDDHDKIRSEVKEAIEVLGPTNRFILHPVDAIFPDTPWESIEVMINAWKEFR
jgi:hypothetical protein